MADPYAPYAKPTQEGPTPQQIKDTASTASTVAGTTRVTALTPLEVEEKELSIEAKQRKRDEDAAAKEAAKAAQAAAAQKNREQMRNFLEDIQRARKLLSNPMATGPAAQLTGGIYSTPAYDLSAMLAALKNPIVLEAMQSARAGSKVGATGFGALSGKELDLLAGSLGSLREGQSTEQLLDTLNRIDLSTRRFMAYNAGYDPNKPEGAILVGLPRPKGTEEPPTPTGGDLKSGKWTKNPELLGVDAAVTSMIKAGRSEAEIRQWLNEYQPELGDKTQYLQANIDYYRKTKKDPRVGIERQFVPSESKIGTAGDSSLGAFAAGGADQILAGAVDELSGNREQTAAVMRGLAEKYPLEYGAGQLTGGITSSLVPVGVAAKFGKTGGGILEGIVQNAAYGAGSAEPGQRMSNAFYESLMTPITNLFGNVVGKTIGVPLQGAPARVRLLADKYGINLTPGQMTKGKVEQTVSALPIVGNQIRARRNETLDQFNIAAFDEGLKPIGVKVSAPGQAGIAEAQQAVSGAYKDALDGLTLTPDTNFVQQVRGPAYSKLSKLRDVGPEIQQEVDDIFTRHAGPNGEISGEGLQMALQDLQKLKTDYKTDTRWRTNIAPHLDEISDGYSGLLERQFPENFQKFKKANEAYRNVSILETAVDTATDGDIFNPGKLRQATRQGTTRFGGKKASARGERPFNALVMSSLDVIPKKYDDVSLGAQIATPALAGGAGLTYGGLSLMAQPEQGGNDQGEGEGSSVLPAPLAYGLGAGLLASIPYSRFGNRGMAGLLRGSRTPGQQELGSLIERYTPALFRGIERGATSEPGVPSPQEPVPMIDPQTQALLDQMAFAEPPKDKESIITIDGRDTDVGEDGRRYFLDTNELVEVDPLADRSDPALGKYRGGSVQEFAMGGMAHSLGAEMPQMMVPMPVSALPREVVVPMGMRRGGTVQAFRNGGMASIADLARHYGMRR
jgi:hypothetical protein